MIVDLSYGSSISEGWLAVGFPCTIVTLPIYTPKSLGGLQYFIITDVYLMVISIHK